MGCQLQTKLTPKPWSWAGPLPDGNWLASGPPNLPMVWQAQLTDDPAMQVFLTTLLSSDERLQRERLRLSADQQRFLVGRALVRLLIGRHLNEPAERVAFGYGPAGKPFAIVTSAPAPQFNVAHSGTLVLLAFHPSCPVGVDVEEVRPDVECDAVARRMFPAKEYETWLLSPPDGRRQAFFQAWVHHEVRLKTLGLGLADENTALTDARLKCFELELPLGYKGAVGMCH